jgi:transcriptional regulator with XRE-family HTH domain
MRTKSLINTLNKISGEELFGKTLRSIRLCEELSLKNFAVLLGISTSYLSDIEHSRKYVSAKKAYEYAEKLQYPAEEFVRLALQDEANQLMRKKGSYAHITMQLHAS